MDMFAVVLQLQSTSFAAVWDKIGVSGILELICAVHSRRRLGYAISC